MAKFKSITIITASILVIVMISSKYLTSTSRSYVLINNNKIYIEIADDEISRTEGLSGRKKLGRNEGMLFIFSEKGNYNFWMYKMNFDLDFIFINDDRVVDLIRNVSSPNGKESPDSVRSKSAFNKVLEINAGKIYELGIKLGDIVKYQL